MKRPGSSGYRSERLKKKLNMALVALDCSKKESAAQSHQSKRSLKIEKLTNFW